MIKSFACKETEKIWLGGRSKRLPPGIQRKALMKMQMLDAAEEVEDLRVPPGNQLKRMTGNWKGFWSIRINEQWRLLFHWEEDGAADVQIRDPH